MIGSIRPRFRRRPNLQSGNPCQLSLYLYTHKNLHDIKLYFKVQYMEDMLTQIQSFHPNCFPQTLLDAHIFYCKLENKIYLAKKKLPAHFTWLSRLCHARCLPHGTRMQMRQHMSAHSFRLDSEARHRNKSLALSAIFHHIRVSLRVKRPLLC